MDNKTAKKYVESLIFSSLEPLSKADIKKMLSLLNLHAYYPDKLSKLSQRASPYARAGAGGAWNDL